MAHGRRQYVRPERSSSDHLKKSKDPVSGNATSSGSKVKRRVCGLQAQMLDGLSFDPFTLLDDAGAFGEHGFVSTKIGVSAGLRLVPSSRPLSDRLPPSRPGRTRR
jgi:hypothetical protein